MKDRNEKREEEKESPKPDRELGQHSGRLGTEKIIGQTAAKSSTKAFAFGTLHEDGEDHQKADDH